MGYEIHIIRQKNYEDDEEQSNITLEEWLHYVESDKELKLTNGYFGFPNNTWHENEGYCKWVGHAESSEDEVPWLMYFHGSVFAKNPDEETVKKMVRIASSLNAKVRDEDEYFFDETFTTFEDHAEKIRVLENRIEDIEEVPIKLNKPWWKLW